MAVLQWTGQNWFVILQSAGIIGSLLFTAISLRIDANVRRVSNLIAITHNHREIWTWLYARPELSRVIEENPHLTHAPITREEELFVSLLILHLSGAYQAMKHGMSVAPEALRKDIQLFFSLPIPKTVWEKSKPLQDQDFARFVEACLHEH